MISMNIEWNAFAQPRTIFYKKRIENILNKLHLNWYKKSHIPMSLICHWQGIEITHRVACCENCPTVNQKLISHLLICLIQFMSVQLCYLLWFLFQIRQKVFIILFLPFWRFTKAANILSNDVQVVNSY